MNYAINTKEEKTIRDLCRLNERRLNSISNFKKFNNVSSLLEIQKIISSR